MIVRELLVRLGIDFDHKSAEEVDKKLEKLVESANDLVKEFLAFETVLKTWEGVRKVAEAAGAIGNAATRVGDTAEHLQELSFAAEKADVSQESLINGLGFLGRALANAANGSTEAQTAFQRAGISIHDSAGKLKTPTDAFKELADRMFKIHDPAQRAAASMALLGRAGSEFLPLFKGGKQGLDEAAESLHALGGVYSDEFIAQATRFNDSIKDLGAIGKGIGQVFASKLIPVFQKLIDSFIDWYKINHKIIDQKVSDFFQGIANAVANIFQLLDPFIALLGTVVDGLSQLNSTFVALGLTLGALAVYAGAPFLIWAAGIALVLVALEDLYGWIEGKDSLFGRWTDQFNYFLDRLLTPLPGDSPLVTWLKKTAQDAKDLLFGLLDEVREIFRLIIHEPAKLIDHIGDLLGTAKTYWGDVIDGMRETARDSANGPGYAFGAGSSPEASAASSVNNSSRSSTFAPSINAPITIQAGPGTDTDDLAARITEHIDNHVRENYFALVGEQQ